MMLTTFGASALWLAILSAAMLLVSLLVWTRHSAEHDPEVEYQKLLKRLRG